MSDTADKRYRKRGWDYVPLWRIEYKIKDEVDMIYIAEYDLPDVLAVAEMVLTKEYEQLFGEPPEPSDWAFFCSVHKIELMPSSFIEISPE